MIPIARPSLGEVEAEAVRRAVLSGWVTQGPEVAAFESEFARQVGAEHACAVANCTVALHLALLALGVGAGDEVVTVSHSFIATANAIRHAGAQPVFVDVDPATFNMTPEALAPAITSRTRAVICVHQMGMPCDLTGLLAVTRRHGLPLIEDAACAAGSTISIDGRWEGIGRPHGDVACFSLHPRKILTTGDGGMLTTRDPALDRKFRLWRQHSMSVSDTQRHASARVVFESYPEVGFNYRMTDLQAAMGRPQLARLPAIVARRREIAARYERALAAIQGIVPPHEPAWARSNWQSYCVRLPDGIDQRAVMLGMLDRGIATRRGIMNAHREPAYAEDGASRPFPLSRSEEAQHRCILLPLFSDLSDAEQDVIVAALAASLRQAKEMGVTR